MKKSLAIKIGIALAATPVVYYGIWYGTGMWIARNIQDHYNELRKKNQNNASLQTLSAFISNYMMPNKLPDDITFSGFPCKWNFKIATQKIPFLEMLNKASTLDSINESVRAQIKNLAKTLNFGQNFSDIDNTIHLNVTPGSIFKPYPISIIVSGRMPITIAENKYFMTAESATDVNLNGSIKTMLSNFKIYEDKVGSEAPLLEASLDIYNSLSNSADKKNIATNFNITVSKEAIKNAQDILNYYQKEKSLQIDQLLPWIRSTVTPFTAKANEKIALPSSCSDLEIFYLLNQSDKCLPTQGNIKGDLVFNAQKLPYEVDITTAKSEKQKLNTFIKIFFPQEDLNALIDYLGFPQLHMLLGQFFKKTADKKFLITIDLGEETLVNNIKIGNFGKF